MSEPDDKGPYPLIDGICDASCAASYAHGDHWCRSATLIISTSSSKCGACWKGANPHATSHDTVVAYPPQGGTPGCGVTWTHVDTDYYGLPDLIEAIIEMRPDLIPTGILAEQIEDR